MNDPIDRHCLSVGSFCVEGVFLIVCEKGVGGMGRKWLCMVLLVLSAALLSGCVETGSRNGDAEKNKSGAVSSSAVSEGVVSSQAIEERESDYKPAFVNDHNIYEEDDGVLAQRRLDGSLVKKWKIKKFDKLLYVDNEFLYYAYYYLPNDDGDEANCSDVFCIPIRNGQDGNDVLMTEHTEKVTGGLEGSACRPCYADSDYFVCDFWKYDEYDGIMSFDRKKGKKKYISSKEYCWLVTVVGDILFSSVDGTLCSQKLGSDKRTKLATKYWISTWSGTHFFYKSGRQYMVFDVEKQETSLLNEEDLLQKIAVEEKTDRSHIYEDAKYGEDLFYCQNKLYAQVIYNLEREDGSAMERRRCALFSLDLGQEMKEWHYERDMSEVFRERGTDGTDVALGKGFYAGMVYDKAFFVIWTGFNEDDLYGSYDVSTGVVQTFRKDDAAYFQMVSDSYIRRTVQNESKPGD